MSRLTADVLRETIDGLGRESFTAKEVHHDLPQFTVPVVNSALQRFKTRGWLRILRLVKVGGSRFAIFAKTPLYYEEASGYAHGGGQPAKGPWSHEALQNAIKKMRR